MAAGRLAVWPWRMGQSVAGLWLMHKTAMSSSLEPSVRVAHHMVDQGSGAGRGPADPAAARRASMPSSIPRLRRSTSPSV